MIWQPIETTPKEVRHTDRKAFFYLDWADDCIALNPPMHLEDRMFHGWYGTWASVHKATHWMLPEPPAQ